MTTRLQKTEDALKTKQSSWNTFLSRVGRNKGETLGMLVKEGVVGCQE